jgi:hypothetical protein
LFIANRHSAVHAMPLHPDAQRSSRIIESEEIGAEARIAWLIGGVWLKDLDLSHHPFHLHDLHVEALGVLENLPDGCVAGT